MSNPFPESPDQEEALIAAIRAILLAQEQERLKQIERQLEALRSQASSDREALQEDLRQLITEIEAVRQTARAGEERTRDLEVEVELLRRRAQADSEGLIARLTPILADLISRQVRDSRDEMAEALGPVMGEAIRVQIRESRKEMIEALYPIIGEAVQKAVSEAVRELQRRIDARLRTVFGPEGLLRMAIARLRGIPPSQLVLRDTLPFRIHELFLIQHGSGLLLAHSHPGSAEVADSDLISAMLTAIRDFARDAFGHGQEDKELEEIQYGDMRIFIQSGSAAYLAAVVSGVEPEGFRERLRQFVSELHLRHGSALRRYNGDPSTLPNLQPKLARLVAETTGESPVLPRRLSRASRLVLAGGILFAILFIWLACFYIRFTLALMPVAFPSPTPTLTPTPTPTFTPTPTPTFTPTPTPTPTATPTPTPTPTATPTPTPTPTPTATPTPTPTPTPITAWAIGHVWVFSEPSVTSSRFIVLHRGTPVTVLETHEVWVRVRWFETIPQWYRGQWLYGWQEGWVPARWIAINK